MFTKRIICSFFALGCLSTAAAADDQPLPLSLVTYSASVQGWVNTTTANATVSIAATLNNDDVATRKNKIMKHLQGVLPKVQWHVSQFNQSQDASGLTRLSIQAQARVPQAATSNLAQKLQKLSRSGEKYTLVGLSFKPSLQEVNQVKQSLRNQLYQQVVSEVAALDKTYKQNYYPQQIQFMASTPRPMPVMYLKQATGSNTAGGGSAPAVASRLTLAAKVVLAAKTDDKTS